MSNNPTSVKLEGGNPTRSLILMSGITSILTSSVWMLVCVRHRFGRNKPKIRTHHQQETGSDYIGFVDARHYGERDRGDTAASVLRPQ